MYSNLKYFLFFLAFSCAVTETLFGPYDKKQYCSPETYKELQMGVKNYEVAKRSIHVQLNDFIYSKEKQLNNCFEKHTASKLRSRYYCVVVKLRKREKFNKVRYLAVDNHKESISADLKNCLENQIVGVQDLNLGLYIDLTFHHQLKLSR